MDLLYGQKSVDPDQLASSEASPADLDLHLFQKKAMNFEIIIHARHLLLSLVW